MSIESEKSFKWFLKAAEKGHRKAQYKTATLYLEGEGIEKNEEQAFYWFKKAAEQGCLDSKYHLAVMYCDGIGIEKNLVKALNILAELTKQNFSKANEFLNSIV